MMVSKKKQTLTKGKAKKSPKKSPQKSVTISSMFQKQLAHSSSGKISKTEVDDAKQSRALSLDADSSATENDDSDCEIMGTCIESKYFKTEKKSVSKSAPPQSLRSTRSTRLSVQKARSELADIKADSSKSIEATEVTTPTKSKNCDELEERVEDENCYIVEESSIFKGEGCVLGEKRPSRKLSLQKRKSSTHDEIIPRKRACVSPCGSSNDELNSSVAGKGDCTKKEETVRTSVRSGTSGNGEFVSKTDEEILAKENLKSSLQTEIHVSTDEREMVVEKPTEHGDSELIRSITSDEKDKTFDCMCEATNTELITGDIYNDLAPTQSSSSSQENEQRDDVLTDNISVDGDDQNVKFRVPYYLENFKTICKSVMEDEDNLRLFDEEDLECVKVFNQLSEPSQKLYVRLFGRKFAWLPMTRVKYPEISEDLTDIIKELIKAGLVISETELTELDKTLKLLNAGDLKTLAKSYRLNISGLLKSQIVDMLLKRSKQNTIGSFFTKNSAKGQSDTMLTRAKKFLGNSVKLEEHPRNVFVRILLLFSVVRMSTDDDSAAGGQGQLFQMLLVNMGKVVYPTYTVNKKTQIFKNKESLMRYEKALHMETELLTKIEKKDYEGAYEIFTEANKEFTNVTKDKIQMKEDLECPVFLRSFTTGHIYTRIMNQGIDIIQRRKEYKQAVELIESLLAQDVYCRDYRGYWWERCALNLETHLKQPQKALEVIKNGLNDQFVKVGHRYALFLRAEKLCSSNTKWKDRIKEFEHEEIIEAPKHYFEGRILPHTIPGSRFAFMTGNSYTCDNEDVTACGVEQLSLEHYRDNGFPEGLHAEGSIVSNLFCLFFWDIIFMDVPDAFHGPYQTNPLDSHSDMFYTNRKTALDDRLMALKESTEEQLNSRLTETWEAHNGEMCAGMNWERFKSIEHAQGLVNCMGGVKLSRLLERYVKNPRHTRSGFPDLTLWNTETKQLKIVEVKGPGDRLSHKQMLWLDYLIKLGIEAEVCHVKAIGAKMLRAAR